MQLELIKQLRKEAEINEGQLLDTVNKCKLQIYDALRYSPHFHESIVITAYTLSRLNLYNNPFMSYQDMLNVIEPDLRPIINEFVPSENWENINKIVEYYDNEIFELVPFLPDVYSKEFGEYNTPESIIDLIKEILKKKNPASIADICCGKGNYLVDSFLDDQNPSYYGIDINPYVVAIAKIRSALLDNRIEIEQGSAFKDDNRKYDAIFSHFPFSHSVNVYEHLEGPFDTFSKRIKDKTGELPSRSKGDWAFVMSVEDRLNDDGIGACLISTSALAWNTPGDSAIKKYLLDRNLIETIINLPKGLYDYVSVPTSLILLNKKKEGNSVRMIDASSLFEKGRRINYLSEKNIKDILFLCDKDDEKSRLVSIEEIIENDYNILPTRYNDSSIIYENGVQFGELIKSITRGAPLTAAELDKISALDETPFQYLMLSNINNGIIDIDLPYIKAIDQKFEKYCIKNNNLLLSKNGAPYKVAVASIEDGKKILANGNLFVIEVDEQRVNPHYLKAFFSSYDGEKALNSASNQGIIPSISLTNLKSIVIPLPPIETQNKIAERFLILEDEIKLLEIKIKKAKEQLRMVIDEGRD